MFDEIKLWDLSFNDGYFVNFAVSQVGLYQPTVINVSRKRVAVKPLNAEPKRNDSVVVAASTVVAPGMF